MFCLFVFSGHLCYLLSTPHHVLVKVGSDANFSCKSNIPNGISWYFRKLGESSWLLLSDAMLLQTSVSVVISARSDHETSTLTMRGFQRQFAGTCQCVDDNEAAFAELTVLGK